MSPKIKIVPDEVLSKEFLSQFKTEADVRLFLKQLPTQVLEKMLEGEWMYNGSPISCVMVEFQFVHFF